MSENVKKLMESYISPDLTGSKENLESLLKKLEYFKTQWGVKDDKYIEFLGTPLIGIYPIRFSVKDESELMSSILEIDKDELQADLLQTPGVNPNYKVSSNVINVTLSYLIHIYATNKSLSSNVKNKAMNVLYHIFAYKQVGSLYGHYFTYDVDRNLAQIVFENLPNKYLLKKLGSWEALFDYQTTLLLPPSGANNQRLIRYTDDDILRSINDMQGRIRSIIKNLTSELHNYINKNGSKITSVTLIQADEENGDGIKDTVTGYNIQTDFIKSIIFSPSDFVNEDFIYVVGKLIPNCKTDKLTDVLNYISVYKPNTEDVNFIVDTVIKQGIHYLRTKGITGDYIKNISKVLTELKGYFSASKVKVEDLTKSKKLAYSLIGEAINSNTKWVIVPLVLGLFVYIFLRSINK